MFFGEYEVSFTGKGRIVLPKKLRALLQGGVFILTKAKDSCLAGYDSKDWEKRASKLLDVSLLEEENLDRRRFIFASAVSVDIDDQGRFVMPENLLSYSNLEKKAIVIGVGDHFEIWEPEKWKDYVKNINKS